MFHSQLDVFVSVETFPQEINHITIPDSPIKVKEKGRLFFIAF